MKYISKANITIKEIMENCFGECQESYLTESDKVYQMQKNLLNNTFEKDSLCIDISELNDSLSKSFLYFIIPAFDYFEINEFNIKCLTNVINNCIPEGYKILDMIGNELNLLSEIVCLNDKGKRYLVKDSFKLYNQGIALVHFRRMEVDIKNISEGIKKETREMNYKYLQDIQGNITYWNYGLSNVLWENYKYKYSDQYGVGVLHNDYLQIIINDFKKIYWMFTEEYFCNSNNRTLMDVIDMYYCFSKHEIDLKSNSLKMQFAQLVYIFSPFVEESHKEDIAKLFDICWKIFRNCEIARIYIEDNEYKPRKEICDIGREDRTTRIHIIFSLENCDIYSLRIDMPHKGVEYVHINTQEIKGENVVNSAMPILSRKLLLEVEEILGSDMDKFFYKTDEGVLWFRIGFLDRINEVDDDIKKQRLEAMYEKQKHFEIGINTDGYELFNEFKYYLKIYLSDYIQINTILDIKKEIILYRCILWSRRMIEQLLFEAESEKNMNKIICNNMKHIKKEFLI